MRTNKKLELVEVNTADLEGMALDYAVGMAEGKELELPGSVRGRTSIVWCDPFVVKNEGRPDFHDKTRRKWEPSTDWSQGGPLIVANQLTIEPSAWDVTGACVLWRAQEQDAWVFFEHKTVLVAAMRAVTYAKCGPTVSVPKLLLS
ncbi:phage protein NinX family protein [Pseudomonas viridiflava]|uniref:phage protein NinX family protein n=1 Tax=Pseudomonas viridiflava TaxID=33069 RepID=UPI000F028245|nr:phage protein NinX family protein [Pseudomonas viridiflava]